MANFKRVNISKKEKRMRKKLEEQNDDEESISGFLNLISKKKK